MTIVWTIFFTKSKCAGGKIVRTRMRAGEAPQREERGMKACKRFVVASVGAALAAISGASFGSGFQLMEQNASGLGNAYAGQAAAAENASTVFFNPAGREASSCRQD